MKFASPTKLVPLPPVIIRLSALLDMDALDPAAPWAPAAPLEPEAPCATVAPCEEAATF